MSLTDPIADMLTILRNAVRAKHEQADVRRSQMAGAILNVLKRERFIYDFKTIEDNRQGVLRVYLKPPAGLGEGAGPTMRRLHSIRRVSKPGLRIYAESAKMPRVLNGIGVSVVTTSKGVMTGNEARRNRVGGEVLLTVW